MAMELFLGSLTILTLAGIIIVALTSSDRITRSDNFGPGNGSNRVHDKQSPKR